MPKRSLLDDHAIPRDYAVFQHFHREEDMHDMADTLREINVAARTGNDPPPDAWQQLYVGTALRPRFWLEIPAADFERARFFLRERAEEDITESDLLEHPFADYGTEELKDVLREERNWDIYASVVARKLLLRREKDVDLAELRAEERRRVKHKYEPRRGSPALQLLIVVIGVVCGWTLQFLGWALTVGILIHYARSQHRHPDGERVYEYASYARKSASWGLIVVVGSFMVSAGLKIFYYGRGVELMEWLWVWR